MCWQDSRWRVLRLPFVGYARDDSASHRPTAQVVMRPGEYCYSAGTTEKSNRRLAPADPAPYAPTPDELRKQYSPGFSGVFGTTLYMPGLNFVKPNPVLAFSSVPEDAPNALPCITIVSRASFFSSNFSKVNSLGVVVPPKDA